LTFIFQLKQFAEFYYRSPPTTSELRKLLDATKSLRLTDEKTIKLLNGILVKARLFERT
jgi:hypothetical protein